MWQGQLVRIEVASSKGAVPHELATVHVTEAGIDGDRYATGAGRAPDKQGRPDKAVTLIAEETLARIKDGLGVLVTHGQTRRNLLTRGVPLNDLIGQRFQVGDAILEGVELSDPCRYLEGLTKLPMRKLLEGCGGLRAKVIRPGVIKADDPIVPCDSLRSDSLRSDPLRRDPSP
jgi:MOSC domain-containing protein YiiM